MKLEVYLQDYMKKKKSAEFAKKILGHKSMRMTDKYLDDRGNGYVEL